MRPCRSDPKRCQNRQLGPCPRGSRRNRCSRQESADRAQSHRTDAAPASTRPVLRGFRSPGGGTISPTSESTLGKLRRLLIKTLAPTSPDELCLTSTAETPWLPAVELRFSITSSNNPAHSVKVVGAGFTNIVLWDITSFAPYRQPLETLRQESILVAFVGWPHHQERLELPDNFSSCHTPSA